MNTIYCRRAVSSRLVTWLFALVTAAALAGCAHGPGRMTGTAGQATPDALAPLPAKYAGTLPCADCGGIDYQLTVGPGGFYVLRQHYDTPDDVDDFVEVGRWQANKQATTLKLTPADSDGLTTSQWAIAADGRLVALDGQGQRITDDDRYTLSRQATIATTDLADTDWFLVNAPDAHRGAEAYIRLAGDDEHVAGSTGCNRLMGRYTRDDTELSFDEMATTRRACLAYQDTEQSMLEALRQTRRAYVLGTYLLLLGPADDLSPVAIFQARSQLTSAGG